jgi:hypothetical protein
MMQSLHRLPTAGISADRSKTRSNRNGAKAQTAVVIHCSSFCFGAAPI